MLLSAKSKESATIVYYAIVYYSLKCSFHVRTYVPAKLQNVKRNQLHYVKGANLLMKFENDFIENVRVNQGRTEGKNRPGHSVKRPAPAGTLPKDPGVLHRKMFKI